MPRDLRHFYIVAVDNRVVAYATNLSAFIKEVKGVKEICSQIKSETTYQRFFKMNRLLDLVGTDGKVYTLQKVV